MIFPPRCCCAWRTFTASAWTICWGVTKRPPPNRPAAGPGSLQLAALRREHGMTQAQAAALLGCSTSLYARYERGERPLPLPLAVKLADLYGVTLDRLAGRG